MELCVVYESMYGNTHEIAAAIGAGLGSADQVPVCPVGELDPLQVASLDLLVVGAPTHVHGLSRARTRAAAVEDADKHPGTELDPDAPGPGLREWLDRLPDGTGVRFAAFDTRIDKPTWLVGSAARGIAKRLRRRGFHQAIEPESFFVDDSTGPLADGEVERARRWGAGLAQDLRGSRADEDVAGG